eukprot:1191424-Prorocentrum_minimum.AAC.7
MACPLVRTIVALEEQPVPERRITAVGTFFDRKTGFGRRRGVVERTNVRIFPLRLRYRFYFGLLAQAEAAAFRSEAAAAAEKASALAADAERYLAQWRSAKSSYEQELLQHAENIKRLNVAEAEAEESRAALRAATAKQQDASAALAAAQC